jgi:hypothetical protein
MRHPNRNTSKGEDQYKGKENTRESNTVKNETIAETEKATVTPEELPGVLTKEIFTELANYQAEPAISVYIATHRAGVEVNERFDPINFKNALQQVNKTLAEKGMDQGTIGKLLEPGYQLTRDDQFWTNLSEGLAVFIADGFFKYIRMPLTPMEHVHVNASFYITPLIPVMTSKEYFYLLTISKKQPKLFRADAFGMQYVPVEGMPYAVDDVVRFEEKEDQKLFRTGGRGGTGGANFHGQGGGQPDEKTNIATYLEEVDDTIWKQILHDENVPLMLAGVEYLIPIYKSVTDYNNIWPEALTGNHQYDDIPTLYQQAKAVMQPYFEQRLTRALEVYGNQSATGLTSSIPADVIPATHYSQVSHLFVSKGEHIWGTFNEMTNELVFHENDAAGAEDLLDKAVIKTIVNGGEVFILDREKMPAESQVAALMRY